MRLAAAILAFVAAPWTAPVAAQGTAPRDTTPRASATGMPETRDPRTVQPERPTVATHAGTVAPGYAELETGVERDRYPGTHVLLVPTELKLGLASHAQLAVVATGMHGTAGGDAATGLGDVTVDVKVRVLDDAPLLGDLALQPGITFPTGSTANGFGTGETGGSLLLISSHVFGGVAFDANVGATVRTGNGSRAPRTATLWTASFGIPVAGSLAWAAELFGYPGTGGAAGQSPSVAVLTGPTYTPARWLALDAGVITPVHGPQAHAIYAGAVVNFGCAIAPLCGGR